MKIRHRKKRLPVRARRPFSSARNRLVEEQRILILGLVSHPFSLVEPHLLSLVEPHLLSLVEPHLLSLVEPHPHFEV